MKHIVVNEEQARIIADAGEGIEIRDTKGKHLGYVAHGFDQHDIAVALQRRESDEPRHSTGDVLKHIESLSDK